MKRSVFRALVFVGGFFILAPVAPLVAEPKATATAEPRLDMPVSLSVSAQTPTIDIVLPSVIGDIQCTPEFRVEANTARVRMFVEASALYYKGDPNNTAVTPIPLHDSGADINAEGAVAQGSANGTKAAFVGPGDLIDVYPTRKTEEILFLSSDPLGLTFVHTVFVTVKWRQDDPIKPAGRYRGKIKLTCMAEAPL